MNQSVNRANPPYTDVIILCAGRGSRLNSDTPKALQLVCDKPLLHYILSCAQTLGNLHVVYGDPRIRDHFGDHFCGTPISWSRQATPDGTASAIECALPAIAEHSQCLILPGDVPLIEASMLRPLLEQNDSHSLGLLTMIAPDPYGYGRIVHQGQHVHRIIEEKEANAEVRAITEVFSGVMVAPAQVLRRFLPPIQPSGVTQERYYTHIVKLAHNAGISVRSICSEHFERLRGINTRAQQADAEQWLKTWHAQEAMRQGVRLVDPHNTDIRATLTAGRDCTLDTGVVLIGEVRLGNRVTISPYSVIADCELGDDVVVHPFSHLSRVKAQAGCHIGPMARLRENCVLEADVRVGNFVEIKDSYLGYGVKASHHSYLGNAQVGEQSNIGAGTITCNYDGKQKSHTYIGAHTLIGSNSSLVAPIRVGNHCTIGAGSVITRDVCDDQLAISRVRQRTLNAWSKRKKKS